MIKKHKTFDSESESSIAVAPILLKWQNAPTRVWGDYYATKIFEGRLKRNDPYLSRMLAFLDRSGI